VLMTWREICATPYFRGIGVLRLAPVAVNDQGDCAALNRLEFVLVQARRRGVGTRVFKLSFLS